MPKQTRHKVYPGLAIDAELWIRANRWRQTQMIPPTKTAMLEEALRRFLDAEDRKKRR